MICDLLDCRHWQSTQEQDPYSSKQFAHWQIGLRARLWPLLAFSSMTPRGRSCPSRSCPVFVLKETTIPRVDEYKDLGIKISPKLDFSTHVADAVRSYTRTCNLILRCFVINRPDFHIRLFESLVHITQNALRLCRLETLQKK
mgnify:CR=1 FL=1